MVVHLQFVAGYSLFELYCGTLMSLVCLNSSVPFPFCLLVGWHFLWFILFICLYAWLAVLCFWLFASFCSRVFYWHDFGMSCFWFGCVCCAVHPTRVLTVLPPECSGVYVGVWRVSESVDIFFFCTRKCHLLLFVRSMNLSAFTIYNFPGWNSQVAVVQQSNCCFI